MAAPTGPDPVLRVVELGHQVRTAYCGWLLARLGGQVTKLVHGADYPDPGLRPADDAAAEELATALYLDRGKTVLPGGGEFDRLVGNADVVLAPGTPDLVAHAGTTPESLCRRYPRLVVAIASRFGEHGRYAGLAGAEAQELALGGLLSMLGEPDREPVRPGGPQAGHAAASALFTAVMVALYHRSRTGRGTRVATSGVRAAAYIDWKSQIHHADDGTVLRRGSTAGPVVLRCSDGFVGFYYRDEEWPAVKRLFGDGRLDGEQFATQPDRDRHRAALIEVMQAYATRVTRDELYRQAQALGIPAGSVLTLPELRDDPQLTARGALRTQTAPGLGEVTFPIAPWTVDGVREATA